MFRSLTTPVVRALAAVAIATGLGNLGRAEGWGME